MVDDKPVDIRQPSKHGILIKGILIIFFIFLPLFGFLIGVGCQRKKDSETFNQLMKKATKTKEIVWVNQDSIPKPTSTPPEGTVETYSSSRLGVTIKYFKDMGAVAPVKIKEMGNRIYLYTKPDDPTSGQFIEVFSKLPSDPLELAISKDFLQAYSDDDCQVVPGGLNLSINYPMYLPSFEYATIKVSAVNPSDSSTEGQVTADKCPQDYTYGRMICYFVMDKNHPSKYAFINLGQQAGFTSYPGLNWDMTFSFND